MPTKTYIIAEAGVNHNGSIALAKQMIDVAMDAGADAVKFQSFVANDLVSVHAPKAEYQLRNTSKDQSQLAMLSSLALSDHDQSMLHRYCQERGIEFLSSPFDLHSADFLINHLNLNLIKIASGEITNLPLLIKLAQAGKSVILSTGMSSLAEIENALSILAFGYLFPEAKRYPDLLSCQQAYYSPLGQEVLSTRVSLLHCTSEYPAPLESVNLRAIETLKQAFKLPVGYSDHTLGITVSIAAVACGATIIEKHFTLDKSLPGPDHQASLDAEELAALIKSIRNIEIALGDGKKVPTHAEMNTRAVARKSLVSIKPIKQGELLSTLNVGCKRPGTGISPIHFASVDGTTADRDYEPDELIGV